MPDGLSGSGGSGHEGSGGAGDLSLLLQELARAPGDDLQRAWEQRLRPGDAVGRFEILREIGRGGFGVVYEALDRGLGRSVAFKTLRPGRAGHELSADWILKEAEAVARLDHPAIVTLYDVGRCESGPYLVEELLHGQTLEERLRAGPLPAREAVAIGLEVAKGLAHAHGRGVLHRDLKPSNVFLTEDGRVKLLDFGLAHLLGTRGVVQGAGTPAYMAPEQLRGEAVDARADVFALGATLFEALAGKAPFEVKEGRSSTLDEGPPPALPKGTAAPLARLLDRCLSRDPAKRPASGQAVVEELFAVDRGGVALAGTPAARKKLRLALLLAGVAVTVAGGAYLVVTRGRSTTEIPRTALVAPALPSIAVLPFTDLSPGKDQEYFADGVAEEVLNALSHVEGLRVVGRTSSFSFKGKSVQIQEIGRQLNVRAVLEGSVRKEGDRVRVTAQLVNAADGYHMWSESYGRQLTGIFEVQENIARAVVDALRVRLATGASVVPKPRRTVAPEVYNAYLLGKYLSRQLRVEGIPKRAVAAYQRALALDPDYAPAWAGLAQATLWAEETFAKLADIQRDNDRALAAADKALSLDPELGEAYAIRGYLRANLRWDWAGARADFERALRLNPGDAQVHSMYGHDVLLPLGRLPEAIAETQRATELDPLDAIAWCNLGGEYAVAGQLERALEAFDRSLEIQPEHFFVPVGKAMALLRQGKLDQARAWAERSTNPVFRLMTIAIVAHSLGRAEESRRALDELLTTDPEGAAYQIAEVFAWRGEREKAFEWLERAYQQRDAGLLFVKVDPFRNLRGDPRFSALLRKMNLPVD